MNVKIIKFAALFTALPSLMLAQSGPDKTTIERNNQPPTGVSQNEGKNSNVDSTDAGA